MHIVKICFDKFIVEEEVILLFDGNRASECKNTWDQNLKNISILSIAFYDRKFKFTFHTIEVCSVLKKTLRNDIFNSLEQAEKFT